MKKDIYQRPPLYEIDGISYFSEKDSYVSNYEKIACDHIAAAQVNGENPFIDEILWKKLENSTRILIEKYVAVGSKILDVGVGLGRVLGALEGFERYGIDISPEYLSIARQKGIDVCQSKIEDMPYHDCTFDAVIVCDVLEHVLDINYCCRQIIRVLRPGGFLIVRVPFKEDLEVYLRDDLPYEFIHLRAFDDASLRLLFGKILGLTHVESAPVVPHLQGAPRLNIQLLPEKSRLAVLELIENLSPKVSRLRRLYLRMMGKPIPAHPIEFLRPAVAIGSDEFVNWIYKFRDSDFDNYIKIEENLVRGIEINSVFKKPN